MPIQIVATDREGRSHDLTWEDDQTLMECLRDSGLPVLASCGGTASCSTCHVYLDEDYVEHLPEPSDDEEEILSEDEFFDESRSRLSCQIDYAAAKTGVTVELAPEW